MHAAVGGDFGDRGGAAGAGLAALAVDAEEVPRFAVDLEADRFGGERDGPVEGLVEGLVELAPAVGGERGDFGEGVDAGGEEDFVGVGVADAGDEFVVGEGVLDLPAVAFEALEEGVLVERGVEGVVAVFVEDGDAVEGVGGDEIDFAEVAFVDVAEAERVGSVEVEGEAGAGVRFGRAVRRRGPLEAAVEHGVDGERSLAVGVEEEEFAAALDGLEACAEQAGFEVGAGEADDDRFGQVDGGDRAVGELFAEDAGDVLEFGKFGHKRLGSQGRGAAG